MQIGPATNGTERRLDAIMEELTAIRKLLESQAAPTPVNVKVDVPFETGEAVKKALRRKATS